MSCTPVYVPPGHLEHLFPAEGGNFSEHRATLKMYIVERDGGCWVRGCVGDGIPDMHEAIRKSHVQGWAKIRRILINTPFNCIALCRNCHTNREPAPEEILNFAADEYGLDNVLAWLESLTFKSRHPARGWMDEHKE